MKGHARTTENDDDKLVELQFGKKQATNAILNRKETSNERHFQTTMKLRGEVKEKDEC